MTERGENSSGVTHEDIVLARSLSYSSLALLLADRRQKQQELLELQAKLEEAETRLAEVREDSYDRLTKLPLPGLAKRLANEMYLSVGGDRSIDPINVVCTQTDIEKFKEINDKLGREGGDSFIVSKGRFLKSIVRSTDILTRWGGDEFVIVSPVFRDSSVEEVIGNLDKRLAAIPQSPDFARRIRWEHSTWKQGDDLEATLSRIDINTPEAKDKAKTSRVNELYSVK